MTSIASVKWYDKFNRRQSRSFATVDDARAFYVRLCKSNDCPIYARLMAITTEGPIVLGEYRPS